MSTDYTLVLRACPDNQRESAAALISKMFLLKEHTAQQIAASCPIVLLGGLGREEAAAMLLLTRGLATLGVRVELTAASCAELPKIDWPRRPQVFKRELSEWVADLHWPIPVPGLGQVKLIDVLIAILEGRSIAGPGEARAPARAAFTGAPMPEITPFGVATLAASPQAQPSPTVSGANRVLRTTPPALPTAAATPAASPAAAPPASGTSSSSSHRFTPPSSDPMARLNELFPDDSSPSSAPRDITSILNRILPEEGAGSASPSGKQVISGYSLFIAKVIDEERRQKAAALIAELAKIPLAEADALTRKMIIQVLKDVTKEEAEAAKAQFAKIGILARIKGPE